MKLFKKYYLVLLLILCLSSGIIYGSYALYTTGADFNNAVEIGTDITYTFDINNTESIEISNNSNFRFKGRLTNTIGTNMEYKFYYKIDGNSTGVTVKEVTDGTMESSGSIANGKTKTPEFYITNKSGGNITVTVGVNFAYSGNPVTLDSGTNAITQTIASSEAKTGNCTTTGIDTSDCTEECRPKKDASGKWMEACYCYTGTEVTSPFVEVTSGSTLLSTMKRINNGIKSSFSSVSKTDEGIYEAPDDYGTSYYFRGAVENNYVRFAGYYWRIIRINGNGTIRMIYDGRTSSHENGEKSDDRQIGKSAFNSDGDNAYVGFMYGSIGASSYDTTHANVNSSTIKNTLDTWYDGLSSTNKNYIADSIFCGDRSLYSGTGIGKTETEYGAAGRLIDNKSQSPQLICTNRNDRYTVNDTSKGNGVLRNPVGLITADEVVMAGGTYPIGSSSLYLRTGYYYWTMNAAYCFGWSSGSGCNVSIFFVNEYGGADYMNYSNPSYTHGVRPVINLRSDITFSGGNGSKDTPWVVGTGNA